MSRIRSVNTKPEVLLRSHLFKRGLRYRLHAKDLPGKPDLVFRGKRLAVFVHGCFWHQHENCIDGRLPKSNTSYWADKLRKNLERDRDNLGRIEKMGWQTLVVWECEILDDVESVANNLMMILSKLE